MAYASWSVVFGEQPSATKWNILGTNDASFNDGTGIADGAIKPEHLLNGSSTLNTWAWDTWSPTWTNLSVGTGTVVARYIQIGKMVSFRLLLRYGGTSSISGNVSFTLPVTAIDWTYTSTGSPPIGMIRFEDNTTTNYIGQMYYEGTTKAVVQVVSVVGGFTALNSINSTTPMTWASGDEMFCLGFYQAA